MKCSAKCKHQFKKAIIYGVEIDYCHSCRGIWLENMQLDEIIENASGRVHKIENL